MKEVRLLCVFLTTSITHWKFSAVYTNSNNTEHTKWSRARFYRPALYLRQSHNGSMLLSDRTRISNWLNPARTFGLLLQQHKPIAIPATIEIFICSKFVKGSVVLSVTPAEGKELLIGTAGVNKLLELGDSRQLAACRSGASRTCVIPSQSFSSRTSRWGVPSYCLITFFLFRVSCCDFITTSNAIPVYSAAPLTLIPNSLPFHQQQPHSCNFIFSSYLFFILFLFLEITLILSSVMFQLIIWLIFDWRFTEAGGFVVVRIWNLISKNRFSSCRSNLYTATVFEAWAV